jgi:hypothetical protein
MRPHPLLEPVKGHILAIRTGPQQSNNKEGRMLMMTIIMIDPNKIPSLIPLF